MIIIKNKEEIANIKIIKPIIGNVGYSHNQPNK